MDRWQITETPPLPGVINMQVDLLAFSGFEKGEVPSTLRIYSWQKPCVSLGYSQKIDEEIDAKKAGALGWEVVQRPTGGGIVFHNTAEVTYSLVTALDNSLLPPGLIPSYKKISEAVVWALKSMGIEAEITSPLSPPSADSFPSPSKMERGVPSLSRDGVRSLCFSYPAEYEIVVDGKKIVGSAQKRGKRALLQQGSIFVRPNAQEVYSVLKKPHEELNAISVEEVLGRVVPFVEMKQALIAGFKKVLKVSL